MTQGHADSGDYGKRRRSAKALTVSNRRRIPQGRSFRTGRTTALSDGVFAIALTLLVLQLRVPSAAEQRQHGSLAAALLAGWPGYISYVATFLIVAVVWMNHHAVFARVALVDKSLQWLNIGELFVVSSMFFPTALVADSLPHGLFSEAAKTATSIYAATFTCAAAFWVLLWHHLSNHPHLLRTADDVSWAALERRRGLVGVCLYAAGIPLALFVPLAAIALFVVLGIFYTITAEGVMP